MLGTYIRSANLKQQKVKLLLLGDLHSFEVQAKDEIDIVDESS